MASIFDFQHTQTSDSLRSNPVVLPEPENMDIAAGMSLPLCIEAEIRLIAFLMPSSWIFDFRFHPAVFLRLMVPLRSWYPENIGMDTGIMFLSRRIAELLGDGRVSRYKIRSAVRGLTTSTSHKSQLGPCRQDMNEISTAPLEVIGWFVSTQCQHNSDYIDGGSQRTIFAGGQLHQSIRGSATGLPKELVAMLLH
jgi:hypothetical protein